MTCVFAFLHAERYTEQDILYNIKNIINIPVAFVFLVCKCGRIDEEEESRGKIDKKCDDDPEFFGLVNEHD